MRIKYNMGKYILKEVMNQLKMREILEHLKDVGKKEVHGKVDLDQTLKLGRVIFLTEEEKDYAKNC